MICPLGGIGANALWSQARALCTTKVALCQRVPPDLPHVRDVAGRLGGCVAFTSRFS